MDLAAPYKAVIGRTDGDVLSVLAGTTRPLAGREVARIAGISQNGAWTALRRLAEQGLVDEERAGGKVLLYTLNRDHLAAEAVVNLMRLRAALVERIRDQLSSWPIQPIHVSIFGSAVRGDGDVRSDIDLFVVRPRGIDEEDEQWREQVDALATSIRRWTGNHAGIADVPETEVSRLRRERPPIVGELERDAVLLAGAPVREMFAARRR